MHVRVCIDRLKRVRITRRQLNYAAAPMILVAVVVWFGVSEGPGLNAETVRGCLGSSGAFNISGTSFKSVSQSGFQTVEIASLDELGRQITATVVITSSSKEAKHIAEIADRGLAYGNDRNRTRRIKNVVVSFDRDAPANLWAPVEDCLR